ncbi:hypothetical protein BCAR13_1230045 [Paraburkholderia caribensis]|nr:hypothetical protein BCAR13_1230045 [Paraburkholderia caribensis]
MTQFSSKCRKSAPAVPHGHLNKLLFRRVLHGFESVLNTVLILKSGRDYKTFDSNQSDTPPVVIRAFLKAQSALQHAAPVFI